MRLKPRPHKITYLFLFLFIGILSSAQDQTIDSLKTVSSRLKDSPEKVQVLLAISKASLNSSLEDAVGYANTAKDLSIKIKYDAGLANAYRFLGAAYKKQGKFPETIDAYTASQEIFTRMGDLVGQSLIQNNFGSLYGDQGQETKALEYFFQSLKLGEKENDNMRIVTALSNIGGIYLNKPNTYDKALEYFLRAAPIAVQLKDNTIIGTVNVNIGEAYMNQDKFDSALI